MDRSLRVYFVTHADGRLTGHLMPRWTGLFDKPPPSAYGVSEDDVLAQLEAPARALAADDDGAERFLWKESFATRTVLVEVYPLTAVKKRLVLGRETIPLRMTYAWSRLERGGYRVLLPRFGWSWVLEDLEMAPQVLRQEISSVLSGEDAKWVFDFRHQGEEFVREWTPRWLSSPQSGRDWDFDEFETLHQVAEEWVEQAARRRLPRAVGDVDWRPWTALFERYPPASLLLVGPSGVGKTTWVRRLAQLFAQWRRERESSEVPRIWATSADRISAGMVYLGMWEKRCLDMVDELSFEGDYLYVDHLPGLLREQTGRTTIGDLLLPAVTGEEISLIAECTEAELEQCRRRAPSWVEPFHVVRLAEPSPRAMPALIKAYLARRQAGLEIHPQGLQRLTRYLATFQRDMAFPGKGFRFVDRLLQERPGSAPRTLDPSAVTAAFSRQTGLPRELISDDHAAGVAALASRLGERVIGQDRACEACARVLARLKAGLNDPEKPVGCLFVVGPTGVGKTELAKQLARYLFGGAKRLLRYDMSEYLLPGSAERLLAVGPGVTSLAAELGRQPLSLVLLDEIEKAHPEVFDLLLGLLGEGRLTDTGGRAVDGRMAVVVMTSNLGVESAGALGFGDAAAPEETFLAAVRKHFRPEFFNRLDEVVPLRNLSPDDVERIVDLELASAARRTGLKRRNVRLEVSAAARARLARWGWHPARGARPLKRVIEEKVMTPVAVMLAGDPEVRDRTLRVVDRGETKGPQEDEDVIVLQG